MHFLRFCLAFPRSSSAIKNEVTVLEDVVRLAIYALNLALGIDLSISTCNSVLFRFGCIKGYRIPVYRRIGLNSSYSTSPVPFSLQHCFGSYVSFSLTSKGCLSHPFRLGPNSKIGGWFQTKALL